MTLSNAEAAEAAKQPSVKPVTNAVNKLVRGLNLDEAGAARAEVARTLAKRMDQPTTGATSLALLSRELRSVLADVLDPDREGAAAELIRNLFTE